MLHLLVALLPAVLGGGGIEARTRAAAVLRDLLPVAAPLVRAQGGHPDPELRERCRELLAPVPLSPGPAVARLAFIDKDAVRVAADLRMSDGARPGQVFAVRRDGRRLAAVVIQETHPWGCWLVSRDGLPLSALERGDLVHER